MKPHSLKASPQKILKFKALRLALKLVLEGPDVLLFQMVVSKPASFAPAKVWFGAGSTGFDTGYLII